MSTPSPDDIEAARTPRGAWTAATLAKWGISWPPKKGWKAELQARFAQESLERERNTPIYCPEPKSGRESITEKPTMTLTPDLAELRRLAEAARDAELEIRGPGASLGTTAINVRLATILALLDRLRDAEADAARYRWVRDQWPDKLMGNADIDALIDRERAATKETNDGA